MVVCKLVLGRNDLRGIGAVADSKAGVVVLADKKERVVVVADSKALVVVEVVDSKFGELGSIAGEDSMVLVLDSILSGLVDVL